MELTINELVGRNVRDLRRALGMTQVELGKAMTKGFGFKWENDQVVASAELGKRRFQLDEVMALASYFDVSPRALITAPGSAPPNGVESIQTNGRSIPMDEYLLWWAARVDEKDPSDMVGSDRVVENRDLDRPWASSRRNGQVLPQAYMDERARRLADREKANPNALIGPGSEPAQDGAVEVGIVLPPWGESDHFVIPPGGRFVARDEVERQWVEEELSSRNPKIRVVDRRSWARKAGE
jgi:transcriptional regulator with XRE-family HTH domain